MILQSILTKHRKRASVILTAQWNLEQQQVFQLLENEKNNRKGGQISQTIQK